MNLKAVEVHLLHFKHLVLIDKWKEYLWSFLHHVHFWLFWDDECPTYVIMMFEKNCFRIVSGRRHFAVLWLCHEINIWKSDDGVSMYRDVLYHIFEGYSLFINESDFEECDCTNNLAIHIYLWRISRHFHLLYCNFC